MKKLVFLAVFVLTGCQLPGRVNTAVLDDQDKRLCTLIENVDNILPNHVIVKNRDLSLGVAVPNTPIDLDFENSRTGTFVQLSEIMNQDNIALRSFQYLIVIGRNAAPCDKDNIRMFWESVDNLVNKTYLIRDRMIK